MNIAKTPSEHDLPAQILVTAKNLFVAKGYHGMSMREISDALGVSKAALYYYFKDKEELFLAILKIDLDEIGATLDRLSSDPSSSSEKIRRFVEYVLTRPAEQRATIRLASQEINQLSPESRRAFDSLYRKKFINRLQAILKAGMEQGDFRPMPDEVAVWALLGIMFPYFYPSHAGDSTVSSETIAEVAKIFLEGVSL